MNRVPARSLLASVTALTVIAIAGCGSGSGSGSGGDKPAASTDAKSLSATDMQNATKGTVTWCAQQDASGTFAAITKAYNDQFGGQGFQLKLLQLPANTDQWHDQFVQRESAKSAECDVFGSDVTWTAEFVDKGFLYDLTPYVKSRTSAFIPSTTATTQYKDANWAVPFGTNVGLLYYRSDQIKTAPTTWQQVYAAGQANKGLVYQGSAYEGLTCDFLEVAGAAGGKVLSADGKQSVINSPENVAALTTMVNGLKDGAAPKAVLTYTEEETRRAFESGSVSLERNWTYAYSLGQKNPTIAGKFAVAPLPSFDGAAAGTPTGVLGGVNMVVSAFSQNPGASLKAIDFITSEASQITAAKQGQAPTLTSLYTNPQVTTAFPFAADLLKGIESATPRPVTPVYTQVSKAIYQNVSAALSGQVTPEQALTAAQDQMNTALKTF